MMIDSDYLSPPSLPPPPLCPQVTHKGLTVHLTPTVTGHVPAQLASEDADVSYW